MSALFKGFAAVIALLSFLAVYVHEYHGDVNVYLIQEYPVLKTVVLSVHGYLYSGKKLFEWVSSLVLPPTQTEKSEHHERMFTSEELAKYNGEEGSPGLYLAILGKVYEVEKGRRHYGPGGSYHIFAGRDASKCFVTGDFREVAVSDDVSTLNPREIKSLHEWAKFYDKEYIYRGKLVGRYFSENGDKTTYSSEIDDLLQKAAKEIKAKDAEQIQYPPCNVEWSPEKGSKVWCSNRSGGIHRDWVGVPRKLYKPGSNSFRCACIELQFDDQDSTGHKKRTGNLELYENCAPDSDTCITGK